MLSAVHHCFLDCYRYKLRNIEETEAAKKMLQERRLAGKTKSDANIPSSYSADYFHRGRDYAEKLRRGLYTLKIISLVFLVCSEDMYYCYMEYFIAYCLACYVSVRISYWYFYSVVGLA